ncbi:D-alanyl-D-alanine carboxypeptidase/D-alanyl-D-alanine endopeptidase [Azohydromonas aeria]|uniref:D-alanyl-D-alanine carboxypeptidase/D-alanyl-D-alanine endopeptidase n=1 Tax=Azohydromonas aeria TaxID=2590212 RepID=UPI0012FB1BEC|nr:D-alanyl-D-alanine carboxypeptidase/D-alanyl-D-alanine-endopeptidase [Azohydromonas aeria]
MPNRRRCLSALLCLPFAACAQAPSAGDIPAPDTPTALPPPVAQALQQANLPPGALALLVQEVGAAAARVSFNAGAAMNPASVMKLLTTAAALDLLGPAWSWRTPVWIQGGVERGGRLRGSVLIQGRGDPRLTQERLMLLMRRLRAWGIDEIEGDFVLDRGAFEPAQGAPGDFDGEPLRPYNVLPDALLLNLRALHLGFMPDAARGVARVELQPPLDGVRLDAAVPLSGGACGDWRGALKADFADPARLRFAGRYPLACGERQWPLAYADPAAFDARLLRALWEEAGGKLRGGVREGVAPGGTAPSFELVSPPLAEVVRDINKFSNNVMAQQLFLTLALERLGQGTAAGARAVVSGWLRQRLGTAAEGAVIDNGSGLSRQTRLNAALLGRLLQAAWAAPWMPEFMASLPIQGLDGTLRRWAGEPGRAHLKSGSLRDVAAVAGYVLGRSGRRHVLVATVNHPQAAAARPVLDAALQWALED